MKTIDEKSKRHWFIQYSGMILFANAMVEMFKTCDKQGVLFMDPPEIMVKELVELNRLRAHMLPNKAYEAAIDFLNDVEKLNDKSIEEIFEQNPNVKNSEDVEKFSYDIIMEVFEYNKKTSNLKLPSVSFSFDDFEGNVSFNDVEYQNADWWKQE